LHWRVRHPLLYRRWLEGILELFIFFLAVSAHFDSDNHDHTDDNDKNNGNNDRFKQELDETHVENNCWASRQLV